MKKIIKYSLISSFSTTLYIILVAVFLNNAQRLFPDSRSVLIPIFMLLLFVFSAAFTGLLVFGRSVLWYLDKKRRDALNLIFWTLAFIFIFIIIIAICLFLFL